MFRQTMTASAWIIACLILWAAQPGLFPFVAYLALFGQLLHVIDEGHEARLMAQEMRSWLT